MLVPLTIHNQTNDGIVVRYMNENRLGSQEVSIGPRGDTIIRDAYLGMKMYASSAFDPSATFATLKLSDNVDEVHFSESGGGFGRGELRGPVSAKRDAQRGGAGGGDDAAKRSMARTQIINEERARAEAAAMAASKPMTSTPGSLPGDMGGESHGTLLAMAHNEDLTKQGLSNGELTQQQQQQQQHGTAAKGGGGRGEEDSRVWVPGLGWMQREAIPPHVLNQLMARQANAQRHNVEDQVDEAPMFPNYDSQKTAMQLDNLPPLPPVRLNADIIARHERGYFGPLTRLELSVASRLRSLLHLSKERSERYARPVTFACVAIVMFTCVFVWRRRARRHRDSLTGGGGGYSRRHSHARRRPLMHAR